MGPTAACSKPSVASAEARATDRVLRPETDLVLGPGADLVLGPGTDLVLGLGNDLVSDDGFGPAVAEALRSAAGGSGAVPGPESGPESVPALGLSVGPELRIESAAVAGFRLLDLLAGHRRALIVDVVQTGKHPPGTLLDWPLRWASCGRTLGGSHQIDLAAALEFGRRLGYPLPEEIVLLVVEGLDLLTIREELTAPVRQAVPAAVRLAGEWARRTGAFAPSHRRSHDEARTLS